MKGLRPKELELMSVFWGADIPLATAEIKDHVTKYSWSDSSLGAMIVRLVKRRVLEVAGSFRKNIICNTYQATISKDKYYSEFISELMGQVNFEFLLALLSTLKGNANPEVSEKMQSLLDG
jgi:Penicillinase repressor.